MDLDICPKFLKFIASNISSYRNLSHIFNYDLKNKIKETKSKFTEVKIGNSHPITSKEISINCYIRKY